MNGRTQVASLLIAVLVAGGAACPELIAAPANPSPSAQAPPAVPSAIEPRGRVYLFRGTAGIVFSRGTDKLAERIEQAGLSTTVNEALVCSSVAKQAISDYRQKPAPIILNGHSMGGACALSFADALNDENIPVSLMITTDPSRIAQDVPPNVERYINVFLSSNILGGQDVQPTKNFHGHYASYDLADHAEITHVNIEKMAAVQEQIVAKILLLTATPAKTDTEPFPIRYVVPADANIELWDSGMPVFARAGDTVQSLATLYHVPVWSITQINQVPEGAPLPPGQRVIIPRHLVPAVAAKGDNAVLGQTPAKH